MPSLSYAMFHKQVVRDREKWSMHRDMYAEPVFMPG